MIWLILEKIHGHLALLGIAACLHPPIVLRKARRPNWATRMSGYAGSFLLSVSIACGWFIYPEYRLQIRQHLYATNRALAVSFEVKEHVGTFALFLVIAGAGLLFLSNRPGGAHLRKATGAAYFFAVLLATISATLGVAIASYSGFAYPAG